MIMSDHTCPRSSVAPELRAGALGPCEEPGAVIAVRQMIGHKVAGCRGHLSLDVQWEQILDQGTEVIRAYLAG